jgi:octaprenyl-diphosphate synthase
MTTLLDLAAGGAELSDELRGGLDRVARVFDDHLRSDLECVQGLTAHVARYRGKMLRPTLTLLSGLAAGSGRVSREHDVLAAVVEMIHMATLVHDDVLDEAETRRRGRTINALSGNETAVILGDYLISSAFHLCSTLDEPAVSERIGRVTTTLCAGELLQLSNRGNEALDERTYFQIIERKTASLIALACELGARASDASAAEHEALHDFGLDVGAAFQIQDDLLDLLGEEVVVGKSVRKDQEKGKLTLPLIRHLERMNRDGRQDEAREAFAAARDPERQAALVAKLRADGSIESAAETARELTARARARLGGLAASPARELLEAMAEAAVQRRF